MLKNEDAGLMLLGKLHNAMAHLMGAFLIKCPDL